MSRPLELPKIIGHRGAAALAPENTLASIRRAHEAGISWVEFDVKLTADGVPILMHDDALGRTTDGRGKVAAKTLAEIRALDAGGWFGAEFAGERVPTLEAALALCIDLGLGVNVELKPCKGREVETARVALRTLLDIWPDRLPGPLISSFDKASLGAAQRLVPSLSRGCLVTRVPVKWRERLETLGCRTLHVSNRWIRKRHIEAFIRASVPVLVYTVNDPVRAVFLLEQGVSAIFTDRVDLMTKGLGAYCQPSPGRTLTAASGSITSI